VKTVAEFLRSDCRNIRVEVSLFVLSPELEDRDEVEVGNRSRLMMVHKKTIKKRVKQLRRRIIILIFNNDTLVCLKRKL
jgi:hypothetical protein